MRYHSVKVSDFMIDTSLLPTSGGNLIVAPA
jgi:hypothetical protein